MTAPGVFIAATGQNIGKTTTSLALLQKILPKYPNLSFMKPVGQRTIERAGITADEDVLLMKDVFRIQGHERSMSPVTVPSGFTKNYLDGVETNEVLTNSIREGWKELSTTGGPVIVEGTGHGGVGSVFDMNNAQVASMLDLPVILVAQGGIGRPIDEITLNLALYEQAGVTVKGVIFNKARNDKIPQMVEYCTKYLNKKGIAMLGVVEFSPVLSRPSLRRLSLDLKAEIYSGEGNLDTVPTKIITGAGALDYILDRSAKKTLVVTPASRSDVIMTAAHIYDLNQRGETMAQEFCGIFLTGDQKPHPDVLASARYSGIPIMYNKRDTYETIEAIDNSLGKTLPTDTEKLDVIERIYGPSIDWQKIEEIIMSK